jgi:hypothetical protein
MLDSGGAPLAPLVNSRWVEVPFALVAWVVARMGGSMNSIVVGYGLGMAAVPIVSLALCWWLVHERAPRLMVWPLLCFFAMMPAAFYLTCEAALACYAGWPLVFACALPRDERLLARGAIAAGAGLFCIFAHPLSIIWLVAAAIGAWRGARSLLGVVLALTAVRLIAGLSGYESNMLAALPVGLAITFRHAMWWAPAATVVSSAVAALAVRRGQVIAARVAVLSGGLALLFYASLATHWSYSNNFRLWLPIVVAPFLAGLLIDAPQPREARDRADDGAVIEPMIGLFVLLALSIQSVEWHGLTSSMREQMALSSRPCLDYDAVPGLAGSPITVSWVHAQSVMLGTVAPLKIIAQDCAVLPGFVRGVADRRGRDPGFFDWQPLRASWMAPTSKALRAAGDTIVFGDSALTAAVSRYVANVDEVPFIGDVHTAMDEQHVNVTVSLAVGPFAIPAAFSGSLYTREGRAAIHITAAAIGGQPLPERIVSGLGDRFSPEVAHIIEDLVFNFEAGEFRTSRGRLTIIGRRLAAP